MVWVDSGLELPANAPVEICVIFDRPEQSANVRLIYDPQTQTTTAYCSKVGSRLFYRIMNERMDPNVYGEARPSLLFSSYSTRVSDPGTRHQAGESNLNESSKFCHGRFNLQTGEFVPDGDAKPETPAVTDIPKGTPTYDDSVECLFRQPHSELFRTSTGEFLHPDRNAPCVPESTTTMTTGDGGSEYNHNQQKLAGCYSECSSSTPAGTFLLESRSDPGPSRGGHPKASQVTRTPRLNDKQQREDEEILFTNKSFVPSSDNRTCNAVPNRNPMIPDARNGVEDKKLQDSVSQQGEARGVPRKVADTTDVDNVGTGRHPLQRDLYRENKDRYEKSWWERRDCVQEDKPAARAPLPAPTAFFASWANDTPFVPIPSRRPNKNVSRNRDPSTTQHQRGRKSREDDDDDETKRNNRANRQKSTPREHASTASNFVNKNKKKTRD